VTGKIPGACAKDAKMLYVENERMEKHWLLTVLFTRGEHSLQKLI
jgi:hypothetical protein